MKANFYPLLFFCFFGLSLQAQETEAQVAYKQAFYNATTQKILQNDRQALDMYLEICTKFPEEAAPAYEAALLLKKESPDLALPFARKAQKLQPKEPWFMLNLIDLLEILGMYEEVADLKMELFAQNQDFEEAMDAAEIWNDLNNTKKLNKWLAEFIQRTEYQDEALKIELLRCKKIKKPLSYLKAIEKLHQRFPGNAMVLGSLAEAYELTKKYRQSEFCYRKLELEHPNDEKVHFAMAKLMAKQGQMDSCTAALRRGFNQKTESPFYKISVLEVLINEGNRVKDRQIQAWEMGQILERLHGGDPATFSVLGNLYSREGRIDSAIMWFRRDLEVMSSSTSKQDVFLQLIQLELLKREWKQALKTAEKMAELFPSSAAAYYYFGMALNKNGQYEMALEQLKTGEVYVASSNNPLRLKFFQEKAIAYAELRQYNRAQTEISRGIDLAGYDADISQIRIYIQFLISAPDSEIQKELLAFSEKKGEILAIRSARWLLQSRKDSTAELKTALLEALDGLGNNESLALEWLGDALHNLGEKEAARSAYQKALLFQPLLIGHLQDKLSTLSENP